MSCDKKGCRTNTHMVNDSYCFNCKNRMRNQKLKEMGMSDEGDDRMYKYDKVIKEALRNGPERILSIGKAIGEEIKKVLEKDDGELQGLIFSINDAKNKLKEKGWVFCEHANENPLTCPCDDSYICKQEGEMCYNKVNENKIIEDEKLLGDYVCLAIKNCIYLLGKAYCDIEGKERKEFNLKLQKAKEAVLERMIKGSQ